MSFRHFIDDNNICSSWKSGMTQLNSSGKSWPKCWDNKVTRIKLYNYTFTRESRNFKKTVEWYIKEGIYRLSHQDKIDTSHLSVSTFPYRQLFGYITRDTQFKKKTENKYILPLEDENCKWMFVLCEDNTASDGK
jgi:hypothetical protein